MGPPPPLRLRPDLLAQTVVVLCTASPPAGSSAAAIAAGRECAALGATVAEVSLDPGAELADEAGAERGAHQALERHGVVDVLVNDAAGFFAAGRGPAADHGAGLTALRGALDCPWNATRALANTAFLPGPRGGKVVNLAPGPAAGPRAPAARAALENMARTLSIEWARHGVRITTVTPGADTEPDEVAALVAFLASPAGDYHSGCRLDLGALDAGPRRPIQLAPRDPRTSSR